MVEMEFVFGGKALFAARKDGMGGDGVVGFRTKHDAEGWMVARAALRVFAPSRELVLPRGEDVKVFRGGEVGGSSSVSASAARRDTGNTGAGHSRHFEGEAGQCGFEMGVGHRGGCCGVAG